MISLFKTGDFQVPAVKFQGCKPFFRWLIQFPKTQLNEVAHLLTRLEAAGIGWLGTWILDSESAGLDVSFPTKL